jgi:hypothetical protein
MFMKIALACAATFALSGTALATADQQISVNGTGGSSVPDAASDSQQQAAYNLALTAAITDAQAKAQMVAQQLALTLGPVQSFTEQSDDYLGYCGVGFLPVAEVNNGASSPAAGSTSSGQLTPIPTKPKKHRGKRKAHKAQSSENTCEIQADVTLVYSAS